MKNTFATCYRPVTMTVNASVFQVCLLYEFKLGKLCMYGIQGKCCKWIDHSEVVFEKWETGGSSLLGKIHSVCNHDELSALKLSSKCLEFFQRFQVITYICTKLWKYRSFADGFSMNWQLAINCNSRHFVLYLCPAISMNCVVWSHVVRGGSYAAVSGALSIGGPVPQSLHSQK